MSAHAITIKTLQAIAAEQNLEFQDGDILIVRTGWTKWYDEASDEDRLKYVTNGKEWIGVEGCQETVQWLWDSHFAAVAGDNIGFEVWPATDDWRKSFRVSCNSS
jgi:kynurenine formamidase